eukprot:gene10343-12700_t
MIKNLFIYICIINCISTIIVESQVPSNDVLWNSFLNWKETFEFDFGSATEESYRFEIWKQNILEIGKNNDVEISTDFELIYQSENQLSTRSIDEAEPIMEFPISQNPTYSLNEFSSMTTTEFLASNTGVDESMLISPAVATAAGLGAGTIAAIVAGGVIASSAVVGGSVYAYKRSKSKQLSPEVELSEQPQPSDNSHLKRKSFIDLFKFAPKNSHKSITARQQHI